MFNDPAGFGRLLSLTGAVIGEGHYRLSPDDTGWIACEVPLHVVGDTCQLELTDGRRLRVYVYARSIRCHGVFRVLQEEV
jgi:hypothetical protein